MKRQLIYNPAVDPFSVVFFFQKDNSDQSWSIRDYSRPGTVSVRYAHEFNLTLNILFAGIVKSFDAPAISINNLEFWHNLTMQRNSELSLCPAPIVEDLTISGKIATTIDRSTTQFALIDRQLLTAMPKARKAADMRRILTSPNSEDWVTWNAFGYARKMAPETWWRHLAQLAVQYNPSIALPDGWMQTPTVTLWKCVSTPAEYEIASRTRLRASNISGWNVRADKSGPVEGDSEIYISLHNAAVTVFIEAKLGSDISMKTWYDPERNQIVRNIDCLLDDARETVPFFWMLVRDAGQRRTYTQLIHKYRSNPDSLVEALSHRNANKVRDVTSRLCIILWKDFLARLPKPPIDDDEIVRIYQELQVRVQ